MLLKKKRPIYGVQGMWKYFGGFLIWERAAIMINPPKVWKYLEAPYDDFTWELAEKFSLTGHTKVVSPCKINVWKNKDESLLLDFKMGCVENAGIRLKSHSLLDIDKTTSIYSFTDEIQGETEQRNYLGYFVSDGMKEKWKIETSNEYQAIISPKTVLLLDFKNQLVKGVHKETGEEKWKFSWLYLKAGKINSRGNLMTPRVDFCCVHENLVVIRIAQDYLICIDTNTGTKVWEEKLDVKKATEPYQYYSIVTNLLEDNAILQVFNQHYYIEFNVETGETVFFRNHSHIFELAPQKMGEITIKEQVKFEGKFIYFHTKRPDILGIYNIDTGKIVASYHLPEHGIKLFPSTQFGVKDGVILISDTNFTLHILEHIDD